MPTIGNIDDISDGFLWRIGDIFTLAEGEYYLSPKFSFGDNNWCLSIERGSRSRCINVWLRRISIGPPIIIDYTVSLKTLDGKKDKEHCRCDFKEVRLGHGKYESIYIPESFVTETERVPSDVFAVLCTLKHAKSDKNDVSLTEIYKKVLLNGKNHDLIFRIGDKELRAHQDILRARSHVFESMLDHNMKEKRSGVIDVPDCDPQAMELFLSYVYCGKLETQDKNNMTGLYYIADKYDMQDLKEECSDIIRRSLSNVNICKIIQLALNHNDSRLLEYSTEYFMSNVLGILRTVEWQIFLKDNTTVGNELLIKSFERKNCNIVSHQSLSSDVSRGHEENPDYAFKGVLPPEYKYPTIESVPASGNTQSTNITTPASRNEGNSFSFLRTHPQFQHRKQVIQQNPQLTAVPQQIDRRYPRLSQLISQNQTSFVRLLNDPTANQGSNLPNVSNGGAGTVSAGNFPMEQVMERVERFTRELKLQNSKMQIS